MTLYYLATPGRLPGADGSARDSAVGSSIDVLGVVLEAVHNSPVLLLNEPVDPAAKRDEPPKPVATPEELHLSLCRMRIDELARIWEALDHPFRLSVCLKVSVVRIDSSRFIKSTPVVERDFAIGRIEASAAR